MSGFEIFSSILSWLGGVAAIVVAIALLIRFMGEKWIEHKFDERLKQFEHEKARELERLKLEINSVFSRVSKLHEREFDILPQMWEKLKNADLSLRRGFIGFRQNPNLDAYTDEEVEEALTALCLIENEKRSIRNSSDKQRQLNAVLDARDIYEAHKAYNSFQSYLELSRVFIRPELTAKLEELSNAMWKLWVCLRMRKMSSDSDLKGWNEYDVPSKGLIEDIEKLIRERLYPTT